LLSTQDFSAPAGRLPVALTVVSIRQRVMTGGDSPVWKASLRSRRATSAAVTLPPYQGYMVRGRVTELILAGSSCRTTITETLQNSLTSNSIVLRSYIDNTPVNGAFDGGETITEWKCGVAAGFNPLPLKYLPGSRKTQFWCQ